MDTINELLSNNTVIVFLWTIGLTIFSRMIIKIFRFGVTWRQQLTTKDEFDAYRKETENRIRVTFKDMEKRVTETCLREVKNSLKDIDDIKNISADIKVDKQVIDEKMKMMEERYSEMKKAMDSVQVLERRVSQIQNNDNNANTFRRSDK